MPSTSRVVSIHFWSAGPKDEKRGSARLREMVSWVVKGSTFTGPVHPRLISSLFRESPRPASTMHQAV